MRSRRKLFSFVLCMIIAQVGRLIVAQPSDKAGGEAGTSRTHPASFSFITDREPIINLDGMWRFHPGDDARWASPAFDDSAWPLLRSDEPWTKQGYSSPSGFAWYRFNVQTPSSSMPLALLLPSILTDYEVFENGKKIGGFGRLPPRGSLRFSQTLLYHLDPVPAGATVQFAIRVWHHPIFATYLGAGPRYAGARLGQAAEMEDQFRLLQGTRLNQVASFFAVGILNAVSVSPSSACISIAERNASTFGSLSFCCRAHQGRLLRSAVSSCTFHSAPATLSPSVLERLELPHLCFFSRRCWRRGDRGFGVWCCL